MLIAPPPPAPIIAPAPAATITLSPCTIAHSRNAGGFTYASCTVSAADLPSPGTVSVRYRSNLPTFLPKTNGTFRKASGTLSFDGAQGSGQMLGIKLAFKHVSVAQARKTLKVTLSDPTGGAKIAAPAKT